MNTSENPLAEQNDEAIAVLIKSRKRFLAFLNKRVGSPELAEDLLQNAIRKALESPLSSTSEQSIVAWFYQVLKNVLIDYYRSHASEKRKLENFVHEMERSEEIPAEIEAEICQCMNELLPNLKQSYADLIRKVDLEQQPVEQVAQELETTKNNLTVRLHRARQALKTSLEHTCGVCSKHGCLNCTCK